MRPIILMLLTTILAVSCSGFNNNNQEPLARVHNKYLYREDLAGVFPAGISTADSAKIARSYIDKWIRNQLFLRLAEVNLPDQEKDLDKQISDFRTSLLIHKYQQHLLDQKLDSVITLKELEEYYENHGDNFKLEKPAIRGFYIKLPADVPGRERLLTWFRNDDDYLQIENYSNQYADKYAWFTENWIYLDDLISELPPGSINPGDNYSNTDHISVVDSDFYYFIGLQDYLPPRSQMPFSLSTQKIKNIIINKRKIQFLNELEKNVLNEGLSKSTFQYF